MDVDKCSNCEGGILAIGSNDRNYGKAVVRAQNLPTTAVAGDTNVSRACKGDLEPSEMSHTFSRLTTEIGVASFEIQAGITITEKETVVRS